MSKPNLWSRHSYPVQQSPIDTVPQEYLTPPEEKPRAPKIPKVIRAVQDGDSPVKKGRTLVVCLDGTGDKFDSDNSNIVHLVGCLKKDDPSQVTYYQSGIGTYDGGGLSNGISAAVDMAVGSGLGVHVKDAYHFLMQTYKEGDKICLFGFSRGAYTARCLAGMLHKVGLLPARNTAQIPFAYQFYKDDTDEGWKMSGQFKRTFCIDCTVYFVGVFDCVASVGFIPRKLPFSSSPTNKTGHFRHAMALDEHRSKFKVCHWQRKDKKEFGEPATKGTANPNGMLRRLSSLNEVSSLNERQTKLGQKNGNLGLKFDGPESEHEREMRLAAGHETDVLEVWFMGCHADVGGGAVKNEKRHKLSQIPLRWMLRQTFECNTGILFHSDRLAEVGLDIHTLYPRYHRLAKPVVGPSPSMMEKYEKGDLEPISRRSTLLQSIDEDEDDKDGHFDFKVFDEDEKDASGEWVPEQVEDHFDSLQSMNDQLVQAKGWWILEVWPIKYRVQKSDSNDWEKKIGLNLGRFRAVQETEPNIHWSVQHAIHNKKYKMRARVGRDAVFRVVV